MRQRASLGALGKQSGEDLARAARSCVIRSARQPPEVAPDPLSDQKRYKRRWDAWFDQLSEWFRAAAKERRHRGPPTLPTGRRLTKPCAEASLRNWLDRQVPRLANTLRARQGAQFPGKNARQCRQLPVADADRLLALLRQQGWEIELGSSGSGMLRRKPGAVSSPPPASHAWAGPLDLNADDS